MIARVSLLIAVVLTLSVVGCSTPSDPNAPVPASNDNAVLIREYSSALCPAIVADRSFNEVWVNQGSTFGEVVGAATAASDAGTAASTAVAGFAETWPAEFRDDLQLVSDLYVGKVADYNTIAQSTSLESLVNFVFADVTDGNAADQRIVTALGKENFTC